MDKNTAIVFGALSVALCAINVLKEYMPPRFMTESQLIARGFWDESSGDPMNKWAEEFDKRNGGFVV